MGIRFANITRGTRVLAADAFLCFFILGWLKSSRPPLQHTNNFASINNIKCVSFVDTHNYPKEVN
jgi:hypothetical protein